MVEIFMAMQNREIIYDMDCNAESTNCNYLSPISSDSPPTSKAVPMHKNIEFMHNANQGKNMAI